MFQMDEDGERREVGQGNKFETSSTEDSDSSESNFEDYNVLPYQCDPYFKNCSSFPDEFKTFRSGLKLMSVWGRTWCQTANPRALWQSQERLLERCKFHIRKPPWKMKENISERLFSNFPMQEELVKTHVCRMQKQIVWNLGHLFNFLKAISLPWWDLQLYLLRLPYSISWCVWQNWLLSLLQQERRWLLESEEEKDNVNDVVETFDEF